LPNGSAILHDQRRGVENGAAFSTAGFVAKVALTPTLSRGERGLSEQAFIYFSPGTLAISRRTPSVGAAFPCAVFRIRIESTRKSSSLFLLFFSRCPSPAMRCSWMFD